MGQQHGFETGGPAADSFMLGGDEVHREETWGNFHFTLLVFSNLCFESAFPAYLRGCLCPSPPGVSFLHRDPESPHACQHVLMVFHPLLSRMPAGGKASSQAPPASSPLRDLDGGPVG